MKRSKVTYGQLDRILQMLGFSFRLLEEEPPTRVYKHKDSGAVLKFPKFPKRDKVLAAHLVVARHTLELFGIAEPTVFDAELQKAG